MKMEEMLMLGGLGFGAYYFIKHPGLLGGAGTSPNPSPNPNPSPTPSPNPNPSPSPSPDPNPWCDKSQQAGVRYVAQDATGWYAYVYGVVCRTNSQSEAEQKYNMMMAQVCSGGMASCY